MESGSCNQFNTQASAFTLSNQVVTKANCAGSNELSCLYGLTYEQLVVATSGPIWPSFSEYEIEVQPIVLIKNGTYNKVPLLAGTNHDEQAFETCPSYRNIDISAYNSTLEKIYYNPTYLYVAKMYPGQNYHPPVNGITAAWSDSRFRWPTQDMVSAMSQHQSQPVYMYSFNHIPSWQTDTCLMVQHSTELGWVFPSGNYMNTYTKGEILLASSVREWWVSFVKGNGPVSGTSRVTWTPYDNSKVNYMAIQASTTDVECEMQNDFLGNNRIFWPSPSTYPGPFPPVVNVSSVVGGPKIVITPL